MIIDKMSHSGYAAPKLPKLKGHVKITLHNCRTGKNEVIEGENIVTNAVRDILAANYLGAVDYSKIFGADGLWKKWFGGILLYEQAHPTETVGGVQVLNPDNYYPRADNISHLFAHAGQNSVDPLHDDDLSRGNPVAAAFVETEDTIKQVWEWGSIRGNVPDGRFIRALSLTHSDVGDAGLGSDYYAFQNFTPFEIIDRFQSHTHNRYDYVFSQYDEAHALAFAIGEDGDWTEGHQAFETNKLTVYKRKFPFLKTGLYQTQLVDGTFQQQFTVTLPFNVYAMPCFYFDQENKLLWVFTNYTSSSSFSKSVIKYAVINCETKTISTSGTITSDTENLAPMGYGDNSVYYGTGRSVFSAIVFDGTYFYFPTGINNGAGEIKERLTGYQKINFSNQSDQATITLSSGEVNRFWSAVCGGGLIVAPGCVANGTSLYKCQNSIVNNLENNGFTVIPSQPNKPSGFVQMMDTLRITNTFTDSWRWILANKMLNTTLFNLPNPVQKTSSQSMTVEYTIQEVTGGDES